MWYNSLSVIQCLLRDNLPRTLMNNGSLEFLNLPVPFLRVHDVNYSYFDQGKDPHFLDKGQEVVLYAMFAFLKNP